MVSIYLFYCFTSINFIADSLEIIEIENKEVVVPEPEVVQVEDQKAEPQNVAFNGLNFKANEAKHSVEIIPAEEIKADLNVKKAVELVKQNAKITSK